MSYHQTLTSFLFLWPFLEPHRSLYFHICHRSYLPRSFKNLTPYQDPKCKPQIFSISNTNLLSLDIKIFHNHLPHPRYKNIPSSQESSHTPFTLFSFLLFNSTSEVCSNFLCDFHSSLPLSAFLNQALR